MRDRRVSARPSRQYVARFIGLLAVGALAACGSGDSGAGSASLDAQLRQQIADNGLKGSPRLREPDLSPAQRRIRELRRELGRNLFFDHALGGVEQTACATCHHAAYQFSDARNIARGVFCELVPDVSITCEDPPPPGQGGNVLGPDRTSPLNSRNTPSLVNVALFPRQMWNGRFRFIDTSSNDVNECDPDQGFRFPPPEGDLFVRSLTTAQAHIPVTELVEMTGDFPHFDGKVEEASEANPEIREGLAARLDFTPAYRRLFEEAYPDDPAVRLSPYDPVVGPNDDLPYLAIADAMGHFQESLVFTDAPWDAYVKGDDGAISEAAKRGALVFFEGGRCSSCHAGDLFSDFQNHNIGVPQVGPGTGQRARGDDSYQGLTNWDFGLEEITKERGDRFKFRTPPLRGVTLTPPYMHNGAYSRLEDAIRHHVDPAAAYGDYDLRQIEPDMQAFGLNPMQPVFDGRNPVALGAGPGQKRIDLAGADVADLIDFLRSLTDPRTLDMTDLAPQTVPSGLPVDVPGPRRFPLYQ
jgi:cytochrome c peroxidase